MANGTTIFLWVLTIFATYMIYRFYFGKLKKATEVAGFNKGIVALVLIAIGAIGIIQLELPSKIGVNIGPFAIPGLTVSPTSVSAPTTAKTTIIKPSSKTGNLVRQQPIQTFSVLLREKYSNKYDTVGNATVGLVYVYPPDQDPKQPTSKEIVKVNVTSGTASVTGTNLQTDTNYRVVFDGGGAGGWYDEDWGILQFSYGSYQKNTGEFLFSPNGIAKIATIDDILNGSGTGGDVNGQSTFSSTSEIAPESSDDLIMYNETNGDQNFYVQPTLSVSGGNKEIQGFVMCYDWDDTNPPEGNEISSITYQLVSGTDFGLPSDQLNHWSTESCLDLGANVKGGTSSKIKLSITIDNDNLDSNDDWYLRIDDLGGWQAKDDKLNKGETFDTLQFDSKS